MLLLIFPAEEGWEEEVESGINSSRETEAVEVINLNVAGISFMTKSDPRGRGRGGFEEEEEDAVLHGFSWSAIKRLMSWAIELASLDETAINFLMKVMKFR